MVPTYAAPVCDLAWRPLCLFVIARALVGSQPPQFLSWLAFVCNILLMRRVWPSMLLASCFLLVVLIGSKPPKVMTWFDVVLFGALPLELVLVPRVPCRAANQLQVVAGDLVWCIRLPSWLFLGLA